MVSTIVAIILCTILLEKVELSGNCRPISISNQLSSVIKIVLKTLKLRKFNRTFKRTEIARCPKLKKYHFQCTKNTKIKETQES